MSWIVPNHPPVRRVHPPQSPGPEYGFRFALRRLRGVDSARSYGQQPEARENRLAGDGRNLFAVMDCTCCVCTIEGGLSEVPGVKKAQVNDATSVKALVNPARRVSLRAIGPAFR